jgi:ATP-dependent DNA helicase RecQ
MKYDAQRALELLRLGTGHQQAVFREGQEAAIRHIVEGRGRLLTVQKTGWGKSSVYFIATKLLREAGLGPALLISPLLALMRNQIDQATRMGVRALKIDSTNQDQWGEIEQSILKNETDLLLISPERLANQHFQNEILSQISARIALLVIDEAHCISDWGHDFRPDYRRIERIIRNLPMNLRFLATTATANNRVIADLKNVLGQGLVVSRGDLSRPSLRLQTIRMPDQAERMAWLAETIPSLPGNGIVYTLTIRDAERVAAWLKRKGLAVESYTGQTGDSRERLERALIENKVKALVATTALGMGFDKPDLGFVIHYQTPGSVVAYYQQVGRAGRAIDKAYGVLLSGEEETEINTYFIDSAFPARDEVKMLIDCLKTAPAGYSVPELLKKINISQGRITKALDLLSLESPAPVVKEGTKWQLTPVRLNEDFWKRAERLTALRVIEQQQMQEYVNLSTGHMEFLIRALDGDPGTVKTAVLPALAATPDPALVIEAIEFLRRSDIPISARQKWPAGGLPALEVNGAIKAEFQAREGRMLCLWGDAGWGKLVRQGKIIDTFYSDELVKGAQNLFQKWSPEPSPVWVTCIPSLRYPNLVPDLARRLARALRLPFYEVLEKIAERPPQKEMANSTQQALNLDGALGLRVKKLPEGPVLLVDDSVDSRWTLTVAAYLLLAHGSGPVFPLVLAGAGHGE